MRPLDLASLRCAICNLGAQGGRLSRFLKRASLTLAIGGLVSVPVVGLTPEPHAEARSIVPVPTVKLPPRQPGYQLVTDTGDVVPFGAAASGAAPDTGLPHPVTSVARTATGAGSWRVTADGGVLTSGDALFYGSLGGQHLNRPIVSIANTATGKGYWLVAADGGVFTFGDARFHGSVGGQHLNAPIVSIVPTPTGRGYWLAAGDGGVFAFGDARFHGSLTGPLQSWITGMAAMPSGRGYWLVAADGGVFTFGDALFHGRPQPTELREPVVGMATSRTGRGYWVASADGGVFTFGDAPFLGAPAGSVWGRVVGIAAGAGRPVAPQLKALPTRLRNRYGHDISWPQCDGDFPVPGYGYGIIGVTGGRPFTQNRCLAPQWRWATKGASAGGVYVNVASPIVGELRAMHGPAGDCSAVDLPCQTYNHAANTIADALGYAKASGVDAPMWWIDVEIANRWSADPGLNALTVRAAAETLQKAGIRAGLYSTPLMWRRITGGARLGLPVWVAGAPTDAAAPAWCDDPAKDFTGGGVWLVQSLPIVFDVNYACAPAIREIGSAFQFRD